MGTVTIAGACSHLAQSSGASLVSGFPAVLGQRSLTIGLRFLGLRFGFAPWRSGSGWASRLALGAMALPITVEWCAALAADSGLDRTPLIITGGLLRQPWVVEDRKEMDGQPFLSVGVNNYKLAMLVAGRVNDPAPRGRILSHLGVLQRIEAARDACIQAAVAELDEAELQAANADQPDRGVAHAVLDRLDAAGALVPPRSRKTARALHHTGRWFQIPSKFVVSVRLASSPERTGVFTVLKSPKGESAWIEATPTALTTLADEASFVLTREASVEATPPRRQRLRQDSLERKAQPRVRKVVWREQRQAWIAQAWTGEKHEFRTFGLQEEPEAKALAQERALQWAAVNHQPKERAKKRRKAGKNSNAPKRRRAAPSSGADTR